MQTRFLSQDELVSVFLREAERPFVDEVILEETAERRRAFACLEAMASADGVYSPIERACIDALLRRVHEARDKAIAMRYSRSSIYGTKAPQE